MTLAATRDGIGKEEAVTRAALDEETFFIEKLLMLVVFCGRFVGGGTGKGAVSTVTCDTVVLGVAVLLVLVLVSVLELAV